MSAPDKDHQSVVNALIKDGWTITHDPLTIEYDKRDLHIDLGAERLIAAERGTEKIAKERIVLAFQHPARRGLGEFAVT